MSGPNPAVAVLSVSEAEVVIVREREGLLGFGKVLVGDQVAIRGIALRAAPPPRFVRPVYPSKKLNGQEYQFVYPIRRDLAEAIERALVRKYEEVIDRLTK